MNILVGIAGSSPGWQTIARAEGFPHAVIAEPDRVRDCSAVIAGDATPERFDGALREYGMSGGALLCSATVHARLSGTALAHRNVRYLYPEAGSPLAGAGIIDLDRSCGLPPGASTLRTDRGVAAAVAGAFGRGHLVVLPFDAGEAVTDLRQSRRSFAAETRKLPHETVSTVSKAGIRRLVAASLEWLHHRRDLPYLHLWYYPEGARSVFALRIDTDDGSRRDIEELHRLARGLDVPLTWFVHVKAQAECLDVFARMPGDEIGVHCFEHRRYADPAWARSDLLKARDALAAAGMAPSGFAAPYGIWSEALDAVIAGAGFEYSSEFSYDYDNVPSFPVVNGTVRPVLQVPVHPVSIGSLRRQGFTAAQMKSYYDAVIRRKLVLREPLFFYHHPRDGSPEVLAELAGRVRTEHVVTMTMREAASWWRSRDAAGVAARLENNVLAAEPAGRFFRISRPDGMEAVVPAAGALDLRTLPWRRPEPAEPVGPAMLRARAFNPWMAVNAAEDLVSRFLRARR